MQVFLYGFLAFLGFLLIVPFVLEATRRKKLRRVEGAAEMSRAIVDRQVFEGMSARQLHEAWGPPDEIETRGDSDRRRETWLYGPLGGGRRFRDRVYLENGLVTSWKRRRG